MEPINTKQLTIMFFVTKQNDSIFMEFDPPAVGVKDLILGPIRKTLEHYHNPELEYFDVRFFGDQRLKLQLKCAPEPDLDRVIESMISLAHGSVGKLDNVAIEKVTIDIKAFICPLDDVTTFMSKKKGEDDVVKEVSTCYERVKKQKRLLEEKETLTKKLKEIEQDLQIIEDENKKFSQFFHKLCHPNE